MGVGFYLTGRPGTALNNQSARFPEGFLERVESWFNSNAGEPLEHVRVDSDQEGVRGVFALLHPAAEDLEILLRKPGEIIASAKTSTVGPGYHVYVCDLLKKFGQELDITWDPPDEKEGSGDESGYFHSGNRRSVDEEMLSWLKNLAKSLLEMTLNGSTGITVSLPMNQITLAPGVILTPLGPRDKAWIEAAHKDPTRGIDIFPWWKDGIGPHFYLGRAMIRMWFSVRWLAPPDADEINLLKDVHHDLMMAHQAEPGGVYPWREWHEIIQLLYASGDGSSVDTKLASQVKEKAGGVKSSPLIGYRRHPMCVPLANGWTIEVPGEMAWGWNYDENSWIAESPKATIRVTCMSQDPDKGPLDTAEEVVKGSFKPKGEVLSHQEGQVLARACIYQGADSGDWILHGCSATPGNVLLLTIAFPNSADTEWATSVWKTIRKPKEED